MILLAEMVSKGPTYGELICMLEDAETETDAPQAISELLASKFCKEYPHIPISCP